MREIDLLDGTESQLPLDGRGQVVRRTLGRV